MPSSSDASGSAARLSLGRRQLLRLGQNESQAAFVRPPFSLEHFEHRHLIGGQRIALDLLELHRFQATLAREDNLSFREQVVRVHARNIVQARGFFTKLARVSRAALTFYEFFAGGGMARLGLGEGWECRFANDFDAMKAAAYRANFGDGDLRQGDVWQVGADELPGRVDLAWASSPCQDLSLAGGRAGLAGGRSSAFFGFWRLIQALAGEDRAPRIVAIENVSGLFTSHGGRDFEAVCAALAGAGYRFGALEIDAANYLPQSRTRCVIIATLEDPSGLTGPPSASRAVREARERLPAPLKARWVDWRLPAPPRHNLDLAAVLEPDDAVAWRTEAATQALLAMMGDLHRRRLEAAMASGGRRVGAVFRRMRGGQQRAEARFDGLAGCLRTPGGGSSRQFILVAEDGMVRSRLLTPREAARLMGLPDAYSLPRSANAGLHLAGDGVVVPVVRHLAAEIFEPLLGRCAASAAA
jgi:DNA (cytosine-5)-methyltransferase 1